MQKSWSFFSASELFFAREYQTIFMVLELLLQIFLKNLCVGCIGFLENFDGQYVLG